MQIIAKKLYLSEDVVKALISKAEIERLSMSAMADKVLRRALRVKRAEK